MTQEKESEQSKRNRQQSKRSLKGSQPSANGIVAICAGSRKKPTRHATHSRAGVLKKNAQGGIKRGQPYSMSYGNYLCAECNAHVRQEVKIVDRAQRALDRLIAETRTLTKATKEYRNGPQ